MMRAIYIAIATAGIVINEVSVVFAISQPRA